MLVVGMVMMVFPNVGCDFGVLNFLVFRSVVLWFLRGFSDRATVRCVRWQ